MARANTKKKTGIHSLHDNSKKRPRKTATVPKKVGVFGLQNASGDAGKSIIGDIKDKSKKPYGQKKKKKGTMAELLAHAEDRAKAKAEKAAEAPDSAFKLKGGEVSDEEDDPDMDEDQVEDDLAESENDETFVKKPTKAKSYEEVEKEVLAGGTGSASLRKKGYANMNKMLDRMFADNAHLQDEKEDKLKDRVDWSGDQYGYFELSRDPKGNIDVPIYGDSSLPFDGDTFDDPSGMGTYTKVSKEVLLDKDGNPVKPMQGGWKESSFDQHTHPDLYARKFKQPSTRSRGGMSLKEANLAEAEKKRRESAIIVKYEPLKKTLNADRAQGPDPFIDNEKEEGTEETDLLTLDPEAEYIPPV
ncbi:hypothetical protein HBI56_074310 [Parastagonospora nodorum]|uniref:Uncharacterized protein n=1 Tax=Phaeosphaeria nodorum (strain SN15 / ATCC MYA-4574 / FGSC 10173) TaxID=321614 RepID=A0A7U2HWH2_PHANO|nr:hypothetical protein HBH52_059640 [Parastagonospora nodorum]QRC94470.1 hypothetical protein JI435_077040 [Parastagonospora nodorum SN15]KAH4065040.1 hypothetical protein HBH50_170510 [Parastagonospora nodorum]KAH4106964.1 hypothetical protein HBH46_066480 [Parastagonospora nodorum]KAH4142046.1 hypothetical protein HBH45_051080 [Parastagonospora nodorum]